jgi:hypothetical protein
MNDLIWWVVGVFGLGGALALGAVVIFGWPVVVQFVVGSKIGRILLTVVAAVIAAFGLYLKGRSEGRAAERARLKKITEREVSSAAWERKRIDALSDAQVDKELQKWDRK